MSPLRHLTTGPSKSTGRNVISCLRYKANNVSLHSVRISEARCPPSSSPQGLGWQSYFIKKSSRIDFDEFWPQTCVNVPNYGLLKTAGAHSPCFSVHAFNPMLLILEMLVYKDSHVNKTVQFY